MNLEDFLSDFGFFSLVDCGAVLHECDMVLSLLLATLLAHFEGAKDGNEECDH